MNTAVNTAMSTAVRSQPGTRWLPLTTAQAGLYFAHLRDPESPAYTTAEVVEIEGVLDPERLADAVALTHQDFDQLRTRYRSTSHGPEQQVIEVRHPWRTMDLSDRPSPEQAATRLLDELLTVPMRPEDGEVVRAGALRLGPERWWFWHAAHHLVLDGYGAQQVLRRVARRYPLGTEVPPLTTPTLAELVAEDQRVLADEERAGSRDFWSARLVGYDDVPALAGRIQDPAPAALRSSVEVDPERQATLVAGARRLRVSWADLVHVAVGSYLARCRGAEHSRVGLPLMNRSRPGDGALAGSRTVCTAMNVLPATVLAGSHTLAEALVGFGAEQQELRRHPFHRQEQLARELSRGAGGQLFGAQVNLMPFALELDFAGAPGRVRNLTAGPVEDMTICLRGTPGRGRSVRLELDANPLLYSAGEVAAHLQRLLGWLGTCAGARPDAALATLSLLTDPERDLVLHRFNDTAVPRRGATLAARFAAQVVATPNATALVSGADTWSYARLATEAERVARALLMAGVGAGDVVGVMLPRGSDLLVALTAVQRIGAVQLPLDAEQPSARVAAMLADAQAEVVLAPHPGAHPEHLATCTVVGMDTSAAGIGLPPVPQDSTAPAYLLFTSGSTGRPKGVLVSHAAIDNRLAWMQHRFPLEAGRRVLMKTPITFDVSVWEHFWAHQVGACVVVAEAGAHRDPRRIAELVVSGRVDVLHFVPSMLRAFLADRTSRERVAGAAHRVRHVVCSGEALSRELVLGCTEVFGVAPVNLYGPTEAAVDVTCFDTAELTPEAETVPIGSPVWNTRCYVLDEADQPVPVGVPGQLWLGGVQIALGYVNRPDLTAERFRPDPFDPSPGARRYATGDLARWLPDGNLEYLGRADDQVKVRGQRVELGEVEAALAGVRGVAAVAAGTVESSLVVWYVAEPGSTGPDPATALREAAARALPEALVPGHWVPVPEIPLSPAGKTDRRRLAESTPALVTGAGGTTAAPVDLVEQRLCELFAAVLGVPGYAPHSDFFAAGGDSLRVLRLIGEVEDALGTTLEVRAVFEAPTPAGLARLIAGERAPGSDLAEVLVLRPAHPDHPGVAPLVLLPPAGGLGWCYTGLLRHLPPEQPVFTVQAPGLERGAPEPVADLRALAARQLAAIRQVVGSGAFHVAGWSLGGMAAHEVAAQARAAGQSVGSVLLLDAYPAGQWSHLSEPTESEALIGILRLGGVESHVPEGVVLDRDGAIELLRAGGSALAQLPDQVLAGSLAAVVEAARLVRTSRHSRLTGDVHVVVATAPRPEHWLDASGWEAHTQGTVHRHPVAAGHGELVRGEPLAQVGEILAGLLAPS